MFNRVVNILPKSKIKTPKQHHSCCFDAFIVDVTSFTHGFHVYFTYFTYFTY